MKITEAQLRKLIREQIDRTAGGIMQNRAIDDDLADEQDLLSSEDNPYDQGWRAGNNQQGWTTQDNPYTKGDRQHEMWFNGFWDGRDTQGQQIDDDAANVDSWW